MWPIVTVGARLAKNSKTFERKLMGVRSPLPAPFEIRHLLNKWNVFVDDHGVKLCQVCVQCDLGNGTMVSWARP